MTTFEIGKKYYDTSACDHNCVFVIEITKRTAKTVTFLRNGKERRAKIHTDRNGEYIISDRYSMAPVFRACREYVEATAEEAPAAQEAPSVEAPAVQDNGTVVAFVGQPVVCNCGTGFPLVRGVISGFVNREATRWTTAGVMAAIRWEDGRREFLGLEQIHPLGWRSAGGSPLGVFFAH